MMDESRAIRALTDIVAIEKIAPGMARVITWSDAYVIDARGEGCECPDKEYNLDSGELCKHHIGAVLATTDIPSPYSMVDSLDERPQVAVTDGGTTEGEWTVIDHDRDNQRPASSRSEAQEMKSTAEDFGSTDVEIVPPSKTDGGTTPEVVDAEPVEPDHGTPTREDGYDLPDRSVADDPLTWMPGDFIDDIDGTPAINRKGFEVLSHFYDISTESTLEVPPEDTGHEYCRVKATATTSDGRTCEAYGSAHTERGDDAHLLLEMADTRARKRALSIATGVGAVAVEELKNEVET